jgi:hypothetical protein
VFVTSPDSPESRSLGLSSADVLSVSRIDGAPALRLGDGVPTSFSPDGKWVMAVAGRGGGRDIQVIPTGTGAARRLNFPPIEVIEWADWFPDGRRVLLLGRESGSVRRLYVADSESGTPRALSDATVLVADLSDSISPDGTLVAAVAADGVPRIYPVSGGTPRTIPGLIAGDMPIRRAREGRTLFMYRQGELPGPGVPNRCGDRTKDSREGTDAPRPNRRRRPRFRRHEC